jgi:tyrosyl-tRNA synthetase
MVHGEDGLRRAQRASDALFGGAIEGLCVADLLDVFADVPSAELPRAGVENKPVLDVAVAAGFCRSKGEARRLVESGGFYVNNVRVENIQATVRPADIIENSLVILRSGKKTYHLVRVA